jgi:hypothetical protein
MLCSVVFRISHDVRSPKTQAPIQSPVTNSVGISCNEIERKVCKAVFSVCIQKIAVCTQKLPVLAEFSLEKVASRAQTKSLASVRE